MITATLHGAETHSNLPGDSLREAAYILRDTSKIVHSADAWHTLRTAESYIWKQYNEVVLKNQRDRILAEVTL